MLYFSLLPGHLNNYFRNNHLAKECDRLWDTLYQTNVSPFPCHRCAKYAAKKGYIKLLKDLVGKWLHFDRLGIDDYIEELYESAALENRVEVIKWLYETHNIEILGNISYNAISSGSLETIKYIHQVEKQDMKNIWQLAARKAHIHILKWIMDEYPKTIHTWKHMYIPAVENGQIETVKWIHEQGFAWERGIYSAAIRYKQYDLIKWLLTTDCPIKEQDKTHILITLARIHNEAHTP